MPQATDDDLKLLFLNARTHFAWQERAVDDALLVRLYDHAKMAPTASNSQPVRLVFVKSAAAKERLRPALDEFNVKKTMTAPVTAIVAYDTEFYEKMPKLFPSRPLRDSMMAIPEDLRDRMLLQNGSLQGAYIILAARALGLDCGPMAGFSNTKVDNEFFPDGKWRSNFLLNLGYGDSSKLFPRNPRLDFEEACQIL